jgi:ATP-dependent Clp protease ATP-binding subunit ClpX
MWLRRLKCSFCRRSDKDVAKLVAGASGYICDRCAHEAVRIMETTSPRDTAPNRRENVPRTRAADWNRAWHFSTAVD